MTKLSVAVQAVQRLPLCADGVFMCFSMFSMHSLSVRHFFSSWWGWRVAFEERFRRGAVEGLQNRLEEEGAATNCHSCPPKGVSSRFPGFHDSIDSKFKGNTFGPKRSAHVGADLRFRTFATEVEAKVGSLQLKVHVDLFCTFFPGYVLRIFWRTVAQCIFCKNYAKNCFVAKDSFLLILKVYWGATQKKHSRIGQGAQKFQLLQVCDHYRIESCAGTDASGTIGAANAESRIFSSSNSDLKLEWLALFRC